MTKKNVLFNSNLVRNIRGNRLINTCFKINKAAYLQQIL